MIKVQPSAYVTSCTRLFRIGHLPLGNYRVAIGDLEGFEVVGDMDVGCEGEVGPFAFVG